MDSLTSFYLKNKIMGVVYLENKTCFTFKLLASKHQPYRMLTPISPPKKSGVNIFWMHWLVTRLLKMTNIPFKLLYTPLITFLWRSSLPLHSMRQEVEIYRKAEERDAQKRSVTQLHHELCTLSPSFQSVCTVQSQDLKKQHLNKDPVVLYRFYFTFFFQKYRSTCTWVSSANSLSFSGPSNIFECCLDLIRNRRYYLVGPP